MHLRGNCCCKPILERLLESKDRCILFVIDLEPNTAENREDGTISFADAKAHSSSRSTSYQVMGNGHHIDEILGIKQRSSAPEM